MSSGAIGAGGGQRPSQGLVRRAARLPGAGLHIGGATLGLQWMRQGDQSRAFRQCLRSSRACTMWMAARQAIGSADLRDSARRPSARLCRAPAKSWLYCWISPCTANSRHSPRPTAPAARWPRRRSPHSAGRPAPWPGRNSAGRSPGAAGVVGSRRQLLAQRIDAAHRRVVGAAGQAFDHLAVAGGGEGSGVRARQARDGRREAA